MSGRRVTIKEVEARWAVTVERRAGRFFALRNDSPVAEAWTLVILDARIARQYPV
jgi:hypothetical protein